MYCLVEKLRLSADAKDFRRGFARLGVVTFQRCFRDLKSELASADSQVEKQLIGDECCAMGLWVGITQIIGRIGPKRFGGVGKPVSACDAEHRLMNTLVCDRSFQWRVFGQTARKMSRTLDIAKAIVKFRDYVVNGFNTIRRSCQLVGS